MRTYPMAKRLGRWLIDKLSPWARNPRTHSNAQIAASVEQFGFNHPILVDTNASIIAGHGRLLAAQKLGLTEVHTAATRRRPAATTPVCWPGSEGPAKSYSSALASAGRRGWPSGPLIPNSLRTTRMSRPRSRRRTLPCPWRPVRRTQQPRGQAARPPMVYRLHSDRRPCL